MLRWAGCVGAFPYGYKMSQGQDAVATTAGQSVLTEVLESSIMSSNQVARRRQAHQSSLIITFASHAAFLPRGWKSSFSLPF